MQEERRFSLYTFVNEVQWRERQALEAEIAALRAEWVRLMYGLGVRTGVLN